MARKVKQQLPGNLGSSRPQGDPGVTPDPVPTRGAVSAQFPAMPLPQSPLGVSGER